MGSLLSPQFAETLRGGKYTGWITRVPFAEQHLRCLLWMIGEFAAGASKVLDVPYDRRDRAYLALEALRWMVRGERFNAERWAWRISHAGARLTLGELPESSRGALHAAAPAATWDLVLELASDYELIGKDASAKPLYAYLCADGAVGYVGPERQTGQLKTTSLIPAALDAELSRSRETRWAAMRGFPEEELECLFSVVYEFAVRDLGVFEALEREKTRLAGHERAVLALRAMSRMAGGERFDTGELLRRMERGRAHMEYAELPVTLRTALEGAAPGVTWRSVLAWPESYLLWAQQPGKTEMSAQLYHHGKVLFRAYLWEEHEFPAQVIAAVGRHLPGYKVHGARSVGSAPDAVDEYELWLKPPIGVSEKFVARPDGSELRRFDWRV